MKLRINCLTRKWFANLYTVNGGFYGKIINGEFSIAMFDSPRVDLAGEMGW